MSDYWDIIAREGYFREHWLSDLQAVRDRMMERHGHSWEIIARDGYFLEHWAYLALTKEFPQGPRDPVESVLARRVEPTQEASFFEPEVALARSCFAPDIPLLKSLPQAFAATIRRGHHGTV